jgi:hypothetical protein
VVRHSERTEWFDATGDANESFHDDASFIKAAEK